MAAQNPTRENGTARVPVEVLQLTDRAAGALKLVARNVDSVGDDIGRSTTAGELADGLERASRHLSMMRAADTGAIHLKDVAGASDAVTRLRDDVVQELLYAVRSRELFRAGVEGVGFLERSPEQNEADYAREIEEAVEELGMCEALLYEVATLA